MSTHVLSLLMSDLPAYLEERRKLIDRALDFHLPPAETRPGTLHEAMRYSVFAGGKRLRPILCLASAEAVNGDREAALLPGLAVEILHTYTLIHDDLPAMDNDELRRGKPTSHVVYGEANAILAGDALLTLAFEWLADSLAPMPYLPNRFSLEVAEAAGNRGIIAGQVEDLMAEGRAPDRDLVDYIHLHKTAVLFRASTRLGAIAGAAPAGELDALALYGGHLGLAFQIVDDILDETSSTDEIGKPAGSDREQNKMTYASVHGLDAARDRAHELIESAIESLSDLSGPTERLQQIAEYVGSRSH